MKIDERPHLPWVDEILVGIYLKVLLTKTEYVGYSVDNEFNVIEGKGTIENNGSYNYHNNYDDSEDTLYFTWVNQCGNKERMQRWWTLNKSEAEEICSQQKTRVVTILENKIKEFTS